MNAIVQTINSAGRAFVDFALPMLIQSGVLILIVVLVDLALRRRVRAVFRYWIWLLILLKLVLPPSLWSPFSVGTWLGRSLEVPTATLYEAPVPQEPSPALAWQPQAKLGDGVLPDAPIAKGFALDAATPIVAPPAPKTEYDAAKTTAPSPPIETAPRPTATAAPEPAIALSWPGLVLLAWSTIAAGLLLLLLQRALFVKGLVAQAEPASCRLRDALSECQGQLGLSRSIALRVSPNATSPAVCGLFRPTILIPQNLAPKLKGNDLQAVLLHELAHIKRGDLWVNLIQTLLQIVYFYNPLFWLANAMIRRVREQAVDEAVLVAMGETAGEYPETLVNIAKLAFKKRPVLSLRLIGVVESKSALSGRIRHILSRPFPKTAKLSLLGLAVVFLIAAVLLPMAKAARPQPSVENNGPLDIRLIGVCPDGGDQLYDASGQKLETEASRLCASGRSWSEDNQHRDFIFEIPDTSGQLVVLPFSRVQVAGTERQLGGSFRRDFNPTGSPSILTESISFDRTYRKKWAGVFLRRAPIHTVDLTLRYFHGPLVNAICTFHGPFSEGVAVQADEGRPYELTPQSIDARSVSEIKFRFTTKQPFRDIDVPVVVYDRQGQRHLINDKGGGSGKQGTKLTYRGEAVPWDQVVAITIGEKPHEITFRNITVHYPEQPWRAYPAHWDQIAQRLNLPELSAERGYQLANAQEVITVLDLIRGPARIQNALLTLQSSRPRVDLATLDTPVRERLRDIAASWLASENTQIRAHGAELGLQAGWAEFFDPAVALLDYQHPTDFGQTRAVHHAALRGLVQYESSLTATDIERLKQIALRCEDGHTWDRLYWSCLRTSRHPAALDALWELAHDDRPSRWWPAIAALLERRDERLNPNATLPETMKLRTILVSQGKRPAEAALVSKAKALLPDIFTVETVRMCPAHWSDMRRAVTTHLNRKDATAVYMSFLAAAHSSSVRLRFERDHNRLNAFVSTLLRDINAWYGIDVGQLGVFQPSDINPSISTARALEEAIAESLEWYRTGRDTEPSPPVFEGLIVNTNARGIPNATVTLNGHKSVFDEAGRELAHVTVAEIGASQTDSEGRFVFTDPANAQVHHLKVEAEGFVTRERVSVRQLSDGRFYVDVNQETNTIVLEKPSRLSGQVIGRDGAPLAGARLDRLSHPTHGTRNPENLRADDQGHFTIDSLTSGCHILTHGGRRRRSVAGNWDGVTAYRIVQLKEGEPVDNVVLDLRESTATLEVEITDHEGRPVDVKHLSLGVALPIDDPSDGPVMVASDMGIQKVHRFPNLPSLQGLLSGIAGEHPFRKVAVQLRANQTTRCKIVVGEDLDRSARMGRPQRREAFAIGATAELPNGVTVELAGLSSHPSGGTSWWRHDGSPLREAPYNKTHANVHPEAAETAYEFAVRLQNLPDGATVTMKTEPGGTRITGTALHELRWLATALPNDLRQCQLRVGVAAGPWEATANTTGKSPITFGSRLGGVVFSQADASGEDAVTITVTDDILKRPYRVVAILKGGRTVTASPIEMGAAGKARQTTAHFENIALNEIAEFQFQTRPWTWARFWLVSLRPGQRANLTSAVERQKEDRGQETNATDPSPPLSPAKEMARVTLITEQEARALNHSYIGTEHMLLALARQDSAVSAKVLANLGIDIETLRREVGKLVRPGAEPVTKPTLTRTPRAERAMKYAEEEARALGHDYLGTEHILLGLTEETNSIASQVLTNLNLTPQQIRAEVLKLVREGQDTNTAGPGASIASEGGPLDIELIAVRPNAGDVFYDLTGKKLDWDPGFLRTFAWWGPDWRVRDFILKVPDTNEPVLFAPRSDMHPVDSSWHIWRGPPLPMGRREGGQFYEWSMQVPRKAPAGKALGLIPRSKPVHHVDLTLRYFHGRPQNPVCTFTGPFKVGETLTADGDDSYTVTCRPREPFRDGLGIFELTFSSNISRDANKPIMVYTTDGRRQLPSVHARTRVLDDVEPTIVSDSDGKKRFSNVRRQASFTWPGPLDRIARITFGERPHERVFRNVPVRYPGDSSQAYAPYLDRMAEVLGRDGMSREKLAHYSFRTAQEAVAVIDLIQGHYVIDQALDIITDAERRGPSCMDEAVRRKLRLVALKWAASSDVHMQLAGAQLGLLADQGEFFEQALTLLQDDYRYPSEMEGVHRHLQRMLLFMCYRYRDRLTSKQYKDIETYLRGDRTLPILGKTENVQVASTALPPTERTAKVMPIAEQEARTLNHSYIGTEHILLALARQDSAVSAKVLANLGVDIETLRSEVNKFVRPGAEPVTTPTLRRTWSAKGAMKHAEQEARALGHNYLGTEHILLGLPQETDSVAAQVLANLDLTPQQIRAEVFKLVRPGRSSEISSGPSKEYAPGSIEGRVIGPNGKPLANAPLSLTTAGDSGLVTNALRAITDSSGHFRIAGVPPGTHLLTYPWGGPTRGEVDTGTWRAYHGPDERWPSAPVKDVLGAAIVALDEGRNVDDVQIDLSKSTCAVEGQIRDAKGRPVAGAKVDLFWKLPNAQGPWMGEGYAPAVSDPDGRYRLANLPPGEWHINVRHREIKRRGEVVPVKLEPNRTIRRNLRLPEAVSSDGMIPEHTEPRGESRAAQNRRVYLPDLETPNTDVVLDLASGRMFSSKPLDRNRDNFTAFGKGDIIYEYAKNGGHLLCLRGARMQRQTENGIEPAPPDVTLGGFVVYRIEQAPLQFQIKTAESDIYNITIVSLDKKGCTLTYARAPTKGGILAELPNGVTVELVGLCKRPRADALWWDPKGRRIAKPHHQTDRSVGTVSEECECNLLTRLTGGSDPSAVFKIPSEYVGGSSQTGPNGSVMLGLSKIPPRPIADSERIDIEVGVAQGPWIDTGMDIQNRADAGPVTVVLQGNDAVVVEPLSSNEHVIGNRRATVLSALPNNIDYQFKAEFTTTDGRVLQHGTSMFTRTRGEEPENLIRVLANVWPREIAHFRLFYRRFEYASFEDIPLRPDLVDPTWVSLSESLEPVASEVSLDSPGRNTSGGGALVESQPAVRDIAEADGPGPLGTRALSFDGVDDCLIVPASPSLALKPPFTIEVWAKPDFTDVPSVDTSDREYARKGGPYVGLVRHGKDRLDSGLVARRVSQSIQAGGFQSLLIGGTKGAFSGGNYYLDGDGQFAQVGVIQSRPPIPARPGWIHIPMDYFVYDWSEYVPSPGSPLIIGGDAAPHGFPFKGQIAEIRIWNRMLTDQETRHYGQRPLQGTEPGLVACWDFEHQSGGQIVYDISPNANHAHLGKRIDPDAADPTWTRLSGDNGPAEVKPTTTRPEPVQAIGTTLERWISDIARGDLAAARRAYAPDNPHGDSNSNDLKELLALNPGWEFSLRSVAWHGEDAMALSGKLGAGDPKSDPGSVVLVWTLKRFGHRWGITDIDLEEIEGLQREIFRFIQRHPGSQIWSPEPGPEIIHMQDPLKAPERAFMYTGDNTWRYGPLPTDSIKANTPGPLGERAVSFDGINDCFVIPASPSLALKPPFCVEMWVKPDFSDLLVKGPHDVALVRKGAALDSIGGEQSKGYAVSSGPSSKPTNACQASVFIASGRGKLAQIGLALPDRLKLDRSGWSHLSLNITREDYLPAPEKPIIIGAFGTPAGPSLKGEIAEIRIWNRQLTNAETTYYGSMSLKGNEPGLVGCWDFEHQSGGQIVYDISPNANHAHLGKRTDADAADPTWTRLLESETPRESGAAPVVDRRALREGLFTVRGRVTDASGEPLSNVDVLARCGFERMPLVHRTQTDRNGRYTLRFSHTIKVPDADAYQVGIQKAPIEARMKGYYEVNGCRQGNLAIAGETPGPDKQRFIFGYAGVVLPKQSYELNFVMRPAARIEGQVLDKAGQPLLRPGIWLRSDRSLGNTPAHGLSRGNSWFTFESIPCGSVWFVTAQSHPVHSDPVTLPRPGTYRVTLQHNTFPSGRTGLRIVRFETPEFDRSDPVFERPRVVDSEGQPVAGAQVALCTEDKGVTVCDGRLDVNRMGGRDTVIVDTDAQGHFALPEKPETFQLLAAHEKGFAWVTSDEFAALPELRLQRWGRIEGWLYVGKERAADKRMGLLDYINKNAIDQGVRYEYEAHTDPNGRFVFDRVPPGRMEVGTMIEVGADHSPTYTYTLRTPVQVMPGQRKRVAIGGRGRPVVGKFVAPVGYESPLDFGGGLRSLYTVRPEMPTPDNYQQMTRREQQAWRRQWRQSDEGQAYHDACWHDPQRRYYSFRIQDDGTFRIENVIPGQYTMTVWLEERLTGQATPEEIGSYSDTIEVPEMTQAYSDEPLDLGELVLRMRVRFDVGDVAPLFEARTPDGKNIRLADYRGKFVLLMFGYPLPASELDRFKNLHQTYGAPGRLQIIGFKGFGTPESMKDYIRKYNIPWPEIFLNERMDSAIAKQYGLVGLPYALLIDPAGKIVAPRLRGEELTDTVTKALDDGDSSDQTQSESS